MDLPPAAERYLRDLAQGIGSLEPAERGEIVEEIRSHLAERVARGQRDPLDGFEPAEDLAAGFLSERELRGALARGGSWRLGRALLNAGRDSLGALFVLLPLALLQVVACTSLLVAALKPFMPTRLGLWVGPGDFHVGINASNDPALHEVLGWWGTPVLAAAGVTLFWASARAMRALARARLAAAKARPL
jgi:hypothetical protein